MSKAPKLTPWMRGVKPARVGVYQQMSPLGNAGYQYWNGCRWSLWCETPESAFRQREFEAAGAYQNDPWRGLAANPAA